MIATVIAAKQSTIGPTEWSTEQRANMSSIDAAIEHDASKHSTVCATIEATVQSAFVPAEVATV